MSRRISLAMMLAALVILEGCQTYRKITLRSELADPARTGAITVHGKDRSLYQLKTYTISDSSIAGKGTLRREGRKSPFDGEIPFSSILAIQARSTSVSRGLIAAGATGLFIAALGADLDGPSHGISAQPDIKHYHPSGGDGSSCPYVYAWNGERYVLEAEPFGVGLGRGLELTTVHLLPSARAEEGIVRLRLTNERRETHYVNSIRLFAIDAGSSAGVVLDGGGVPWPVARPIPARAASDGSGRDILPQLASVDGRAWECDPSTISSASGYEDVLEIDFIRPAESMAGTLILTGINTTLSTTMFAHMCRIAGDQAAALAQAIDTDPELIARLKAFLDDASLKVSVWNGRDWEPQGAFRPEANAVAFTRGLRIHLPEGTDGTVRVRFRSLADVWRIDAILADWNDASPLPMRPLGLLSAIGPDGEDLRPSLVENDGLYAVLLPPDQVELRFAAAMESGGVRLVYAVAGGGYLHEWIPEEPGEAAASIAAMVPGERRIDFLKEMLKHRALVLQPVYEEWNRRGEGASTAP